MQLTSTASLHYPITVTELLKQTGDQVARGDPLFSYFYKSTVIEGNRYGEEFKVEKKFPARFESETDGTITRWNVEEGTVIQKDGVNLVEIEELCRHDVQFAGMCANCGKDMTEADYNTSRPDTSRANVQFTHSNTALRVSQEEAARVEQEAKRRLLKSRKLILVVDLDQTIIHATVDPTVAEWQADPNNPNHEAVKDVKSFQLLDDGPGRGSWYYIKLRPGLLKFLENISKIYEMHIYTMGTRNYAVNIAKLVDPQGKIFGDRILSRDESGSLTAKNLKRLFPVDTKMVVIIDDRGDVWNWSANLIKVRQYDFFVGIGDINSSFLPRRDPLPPPEAPAAAETVPSPAAAPVESVEPAPSESSPPTNGVTHETTNGGTSTLDQLVSMGGANDAASMQEKTAQQSDTIAAQVADRPLLQRQQALDKADEEAVEQEIRNNQNGDTAVDESAVRSQAPRHNLLQDNDQELMHLEKTLRGVHRRFYESYEKSTAGAKGGRIAELRGQKSPKKRPEEELQVVPDVKEIMPSMKTKALESCVLTFSGVIPLNTYAKHSDLGRWAMTFGANINTEVHKNTTHVIAARNRRTAKVRVAARNPRIKIVTTEWLLDSMSAWKKLDEKPYLIEVEPDRDQPSTASSISPFDELVDGTLSSLEEDANPSEDGDSDSEEDALKLLHLNTNVTGTETPDGEDTSPIDGLNEDDWNAMLAEIDEASDTEDGDGSETDGNGSDTSQPGANASATNGIKRKREDPALETTDGEESDASTASTGTRSKLQRRKKQALARTSSLTKIATLNSAAASGAVPPHAGAAADSALAHEVLQDDGAEESDEDGFGAMFEAELEKQLTAEEDAIEAARGETAVNGA